jgi:O-antigen biosynthesis protein
MTKVEFTGERYLPGHGGFQMAYEHLHRYLFALRFARGKRVLDVPTGSGYGAALLSAVAREVFALDLSAESLVCAREQCSGRGVAFVRGDASRIPFATASIDVAVAFEILEHLEDQEGLVSELARVTAPGGLVIVSTPNRPVYSDARSYTNPFHVRELDREQLVALLNARFSHVCVMGQQIRAGSMLSRPPDGTAHEVITGPAPAGAGPATQPMYFVALCSCEDLPAVPDFSAYLEESNGYLEEQEQAFRRTNDELIRLNHSIEELGAWGKALDAVLLDKDAELYKVLEQVGERDVTIGKLQAELRAEVGRRDTTISDLQRELESRTLWAKQLDGELTGANRLLDERQNEIDRLGRELARIRHALFYRILCRLGLVPR